MTQRLNLAIVLDNEEIFLWEYRILEKLINAGSADISFFIINNERNSSDHNNQYSRAYLFYEKFDKLIFKKKIDFDTKINILDIIKDIPVFKLSNEALKGILIKDGRDNFNDQNLDIILNFGNTSINSELLKACRYGVLSYSIGNDRYRGLAPTGYYEFVNKMPEIEALIHLSHNGKDKETEIFRTGIVPFPNSVNVTRNNLYELAPLIIPRIINGISSNGNAFLKELTAKYNKSTELSAYPEEQVPSSLQIFKRLISFYTNQVVEKLWYRNIGRWSLIFKLGDKNELLPSDISSFKELIAPKQMFWADPFVISRDRHHYVFIEEYVYKTDKGHISVLKLDENGNLISNERIIERPYHLSYPNIFEYDESYYMVPESGANKSIELYKCMAFPNKWVFVKNIMDNISARDTTLFFYNNKWWLFTSVIERTNTTLSYNELFLYFADDLFSSTWQSHPKNPIVSDHKTSRPAGKIFIKEDKIYRPSQDCSGIYGRALNINQITQLNETEYEEILIKKIMPTWDNKVKGIHTYNFNNKITVMDVFSDRMPKRSN